METQQGIEATLPIHFQLIDIWQRTLGSPIQSITEDFFELGGHSLLVARLLDAIEAETGRLIPVSAFLKNPTIAGCAAALLAGPPTDSALTRLQRGNGGVPLFFFHGDILGGGFYVRRLVPHFGLEQPLYVISPPRLRPERSLPTIEELADKRADAIQREVPHGPYALAGFCIGGVVAYETARQLASRKESVASVVMIDPEIGSQSEAMCLRAVNWLGDRREMKPGERIQRFMVAHRKLSRLRQVRNSPLKEKREFIVNSLRKLRGRQEVPVQVEEAQAPIVGDTDDAHVLDAFQWMTTAYRPKPYHGPVKLLYTAEQLEATPHMIDEWHKAASQLQVKKILGRHLTAITTYGASIAAAIRAELRSLYVMSAAFLEMLPAF